MNCISILCLFSVFPLILSQLSNDPDQLLNWCLDGMHHKSRPGPEDELFEQVGVRLLGSVNIKCWSYCGLASLALPDVSCLKITEHFHQRLVNTNFGLFELQ